MNYNQWWDDNKRAMDNQWHKGYRMGLVTMGIIGCIITWVTHALR